MCSLGWLVTHYLDQAGRDPQDSASRVLGFTGVCASPVWLDLDFEEEFSSKCERRLSWSSVRSTCCSDLGSVPSTYMAAHNDLIPVPQTPQGSGTCMVHGHTCRKTPIFIK